MIRFFKLLFFCNILFHVSAFGQTDLYSIESSKKFAQYLYDSKSYQEASIEFERLIVLDSAGFDYYTLMALKCYRKSLDFNTGLNRFNSWYPNKEALTAEAAREFSLYLTANGWFADALAYIADNDLFEADDKHLLQALNYCYLTDWKQAANELAELQQPHLAAEVLKAAIAQGLAFKPKKPGLAAVMSIVPGMGRLYTGNLVDAALSVLTIGTFAWQSYTGFDKNGISSFYGWFTGGLGAGFYLGNIYGSYRAAQLYNKQHYDTITAEINRAFGLFD